MEAARENAAQSMAENPPAIPQEVPDDDSEPLDMGDDGEETLDDGGSS